VPILLTALLALRRVAIHHHQLLTDSLGDVVQLLLECMHGSDASASQAALMALVDLLVSFGSAMLRHCEPQTDGSGGSPSLQPPQPPPRYSCLLGLLLAASWGSTPAIRLWGNEAGRYFARRLHQGRVIALLEPYLEHPEPPVRSKAAEWLMIATYRPPDFPGSPGRPASARGGGYHSSRPVSSPNKDRRS
jgi:hypothetical protein